MYSRLWARQSVWSDKSHFKLTKTQYIMNEHPVPKPAHRFEKEIEDTIYKVSFYHSATMLLRILDSKMQ